LTSRKHEVPLDLELVHSFVQGNLSEGEVLVRTVDLLVLSSVYLPAFDFANIIYFFTKLAASMRRSTVLSLPFR
jgi:hypothetical protein